MKTTNQLLSNAEKANIARIISLQAYKAKQNRKINLIASVVVIALFCIAIIAGI